MTDLSPTRDADRARERASHFRHRFQQIQAEVGRVIVGQAEVIESTLTALMAGGHVLLEGVPGLGKTQLVSTISRVLDLRFSRIQFTPDLMPADIVGATVLSEGADGRTELVFQPGPVNAHLVLADEINRATPKTQSALLEAMQEHQVTAGGRTLSMPEPFCVMATQNPVDQEGTYPLPEAQLDRFLFKLVVGYPSEQDYHAIIDRTTGAAPTALAPVSDAGELCQMRALVREVPVGEAAKGYAIRLVMGTQPGTAYATETVNRHVALGASPRGVQGLMLAAKVRALLDGRFVVACDDVQAVAPAVLRHRLVFNFRAPTVGLDADAVVAELLARVQRPNLPA